jgi:hypothetical protein
VKKPSGFSERAAGTLLLAQPFSFGNGCLNAIKYDLDIVLTDIVACPSGTIEK